IGWHHTTAHGLVEPAIRCKIRPREDTRGENRPDSMLKTQKPPVIVSFLERNAPLKRAQKPLLFDHALMRFTYLAVSVACFVGPDLCARQRGQGPPPLVKENATVKVADHVYVIPD